MDGGFYKSDNVASTRAGSAPVALYSAELESTQATVEKCGGKINERA